jgi:hypothetical protein
MKHDERSAYDHGRQKEADQELRRFTSPTRSPQCCLDQPLDLVPVLLQDRPKRLNKIVRIAQECLLIPSLLTIEKPLGRKLKELRSGR